MGTVIRQIQLFKPIYDIEGTLEEIKECLENSWTGMGFKTIQFEEKFKEYVGVENAHFLNSATSGLHLAIEILKRRLPKGLRHVITTPLTFIADSHVIRHAGLEPMFLDIDKYLCLDPTQLKNFLNNPNKALAVIFVGMGGNTGQLPLIVDICRYYNIPLILDASHMMGTHLNGRHIGSEGDFTVFSFQSVKNLPTADSGMLVCKQKEDDNVARKLSWFGISKDTYSRQTQGGNWYYNVEEVGWKYHGNSIMAAMGLVSLDNLGWQNAIRREQALYYDTQLNSFYERIPIPAACRPSRHLYQIKVPAVDRDLIISIARKAGIQLGVHYISHQRYKMYQYTRYCAAAEQASKQLISLPIGPHLLESDLEYIVETLNGINL